MEQAIKPRTKPNDQNQNQKQNRAGLRVDSENDSNQCAYFEIILNVALTEVETGGYCKIAWPDI